MEPMDGEDNNGNGFIDESVRYLVALADLNQPYSCEQWGDEGINGIPLIIEDPGTINNWLETGGFFYEAYAVLDHNMRLVHKSNSYGAINNIVQTLYEDCEEEGLCGVSDTDGDGLIGLDDNCPNDFNPDQEDTDDDNIGDLCDECQNSLGDVNEDGFINITDVVSIVNIVLQGGINSSNFSDCEKSNADINEDSIINVIDIIQIVNIILGNSTQTTQY